MDSANIIEYNTEELYIKLNKLKIRYKEQNIKECA